MEKRLDSTGAAIRERIVAGARRHFLANGFRAVTMDELAGELGISKKTLYVHFQNKRALVEAALEQKLQEVDIECERIGTICSGDFAGGLRALLACMQRHTQEVQPAFMRDIRREAPELFDMVEQRRRNAVAGSFSKVVAAGKKSGAIRRDVSSEVIVEMLLGALHAIVNPTRLEALGLTANAAYNAIIGVVLNGIMTSSGKAGSHA